MSNALNILKTNRSFWIKLMLVSLGGIGIIMSGWLDRSQLASVIISNLVLVSQSFFQAFGQETFAHKDLVGLTGTSGVQIGPPCNALDLMLLFMGVMLLLPGNTFYKIWYVICGILLIHVFNIVRVISLIYILKIRPSALEFNHTYTFTLFMYVFIFGLWVGWTNIPKFQSRA